MQTTRDTIVAVSSPPGRSARGMIRVSGPDAAHIAHRLTDQSGSPAAFPAHTLLAARLADPPIPVLLAFFPAPRSYTGDDMLELQLPGNPALLERVMQQALAAGARVAEPGEFTFRAFASGRMDLTQAEGVAATIAAVSDAQLHAASLLRTGRLASKTSSAVEQLATQLALVEAGIDFTDQEDVVPVTPRVLHEQLEAVAAMLRSITAYARSWSELEALPRVVLAGPPSSGKSTLFNALLGRTRAVMSPTPGTTRDVLEEPVRLQRSSDYVMEVLLVDIAGLDEPTAMLDRAAQTAAERAIARADLVLWVIDAQRPVHVPPPHVNGRPVLRASTKSDLAPRPQADVHLIPPTGHGLDELRRAIIDRLGSERATSSGEALALQPRHEHALHQAIEQLTEALRLVEPQVNEPSLTGVELIASQLRGALDSLAQLGGQLTPDDIIGRVFASFCVGK